MIKMFIFMFIDIYIYELFYKCNNKHMLLKDNEI